MVKQKALFGLKALIKKIPPRSKMAKNLQDIVKKKVEENQKRIEESQKSWIWSIKDCAYDECKESMYLHIDPNNPCNEYYCGWICKVQHRKDRNFLYGSIAAIYVMTIWAFWGALILAGLAVSYLAFCCLLDLSVHALLIIIILLLLFR